ncbi:hypothetical protein lerEdw1_020415 [Lerista edwardsae]|nr:hypothetical protein lerEdw1_020415 [Lerista edwardsae]
MASPARPEPSPSLLAAAFAERRRSASLSSRLERPSDSDLSGSELGQGNNNLKSVDLNHVIKVLEETESETGFAKQLILFATFAEVKSHNPLVKGFKLTYCYEDFELKKLLFNMLAVLAKDLCIVQLMHEGKVIQALYHYVKPNEKPGVLDWSAAQYEELQLHAIATLATVAPLLIEDYMMCQGNTRLLMFLEWCASNDPFFGQGNSFHGRGGRGTKLAQMHYSLRVLNSVVSLCDDALNLDLCILRNTRTNFKENDGAIVIEIQTDIFLILSTLCENNMHRKEIFGWDGVDTLIPFMKIDAKKFYSGLGHNRLLFSALDCLWCCIMGCTILEDYFLEKEGLFTLLDLLLVGEIWAEVCAELRKERFKPVTPDQEALKVITETFENVGKIVVTLQNEMLESQQNLELREEEKTYTRIQALHKQKEMVNKSWNNFLARTSNYEALKKAKRLQEKSINDSRSKVRQQNEIFHPTEIKGLNTTISSGRLVTVESTPSDLTGGPLADTELALKRLPVRGGALKRIKGVKVIDSFKKDSVSVQ